MATAIKSAWTEAPNTFVAEMVAVFRDVRRVLRHNGTCWLNLGRQFYSRDQRRRGGVGKNATNRGTLIEDRSWQVPPGLKSKDLIGIPWRVAFALQADGWWLQQDIGLVEAQSDAGKRAEPLTKAHEYVFMLTKSARYWFDAEAIAEDALELPAGNKHRAERETQKS